MEMWIVQTVGVLLALVLAPLYFGIAQTVKAHVQGRRGPSVWQGYFVMKKTWKKETTVPEYSSWIFRLAPSVSLSALIVVVVLIPWAGKVPEIWPNDLVTIFFLLALERFFVGLAGLDGAGTFGGLGASRMMTLGSGLEPAMFAVFGLLWLQSGSTKLTPMAPHLLQQPLSALLWTLATLGYGFLLLGEVGRLPVDNPDTHLELTMMHEATVLEYNGRFLAETQWAAAIKFTVMAGLGWVWLGPTSTSLSPWVNLGLRVLELGLTSVLLGWMESRFVKLRYFRLPAYLALAMGTGMLAVYVMMIGGGFIW